MAGAAEMKCINCGVEGDESIIHPLYGLASLKDHPVCKDELTCSERVQVARCVRCGNTDPKVAKEKRSFAEARYECEDRHWCDVQRVFGKTSPLKEGLQTW